jgi:hypothetical protein
MYFRYVSDIETNQSKTHRDLQKYAHCTRTQTLGSLINLDGALKWLEEKNVCYFSFPFKKKPEIFRPKFRI